MLIIYTNILNTFYLQIIIMHLKSERLNLGWEWVSSVCERMNLADELNFVCEIRNANTIFLLFKSIESILPINKYLNVH